MNNNNAYDNQPVYIVDGCRTPFLKARGQPGPFSAADLAVAASRPLLYEQHLDAKNLEEAITGCVMPSAGEANISRIIALRIGLNRSTPAWTVQRNCASGLQAIDSAAQDIAMGRADLVLAGGVEAMSHAPVLFNDAFVHWLATWYQTKDFGKRARLLAQIRPHFLVPLFALMKGLKDPIVGLSMGQTAENLAYLFNINRDEMDAYALQSHLRLAKAQDEKYLTEVTPLYDANGKYYLQDDGVRRDTTLEALMRLKPTFDKFGTVTAGNSSQISDGAAFLILASAKAVEKFKLPVLARIVDAEWAALDPAEMGLGPVFASTPLMQRNHLDLQQIDYWEINEAFAAQVLACLKAWDSPEFCRKYLGLEDKLGKIDMSRLNIYGGAIALGHPVGASGARLVLQLAKILQRNNAKRGIASLCIGGGQGGAVLLENIVPSPL